MNIPTCQFNSNGFKSRYTIIVYEKNLLNISVCVQNNLLESDIIVDGLLALGAPLHLDSII